MPVGLTAAVESDILPIDRRTVEDLDHAIVKLSFVLGQTMIFQALEGLPVSVSGLALCGFEIDDWLSLNHHGLLSFPRILFTPAEEGVKFVFLFS